MTDNAFVKKALKEMLKQQQKITFAEALKDGIVIPQNKTIQRKKNDKQKQTPTVDKTIQLEDLKKFFEEANKKHSTPYRKLLANGKFHENCLNRVYQYIRNPNDQKQSGNTLLHNAYNFDDNLKQCSKCYKIIQPCSKHNKNCAEKTRENLKLPLLQGRYFCPLGCAWTSSNHDKMKCHLQTHRSKTLKTIGLNRTSLLTMKQHEPRLLLTAFGLHATTQLKETRDQLLTNYNQVLLYYVNQGQQGLIPRMIQYISNSGDIYHSDKTQTAIDTVQKVDHSNLQEIEKQYEQQLKDQMKKNLGKKRRLEIEEMSENKNGGKKFKRAQHQ